MNWYALSALGTIVSNSLIALFVYSRGERSRSVNVYFSLMAMSIAIWTIQDVLQTTGGTGNIEVLLWMTRFCQVGACFAPVFALHFFLKLIEIQRRKIVISAYAFATFLVFVDLTTPFFIKNLAQAVVYGHPRLVPVGGPFYYAFIGLFVSVLIYGFFELGRGYKRFKGLKRNQIKWLLMAALIAFTGGLIYFLTTLLNTNLPPMDNVIVTTYVSIIAYAIVKHQLMDINIIIRKGLAYTMSTGLITAGFIGTVLGIGRLFREYAGYTTLPLMAVAALIVAFAFYPLKNRIQRVVDRYFYKGTYDSQRVLRDASKAMTSILDLEKLLSYILTGIIDSMKVEQGSILLRSPKAQKFEVKLTAAFKNLYKTPSETPLTSRNAVIGYLLRDEEPIVREEMERILPSDEAELLSEEMKMFDADVAIPMMRKDKLIGIILLGPKLSGDIYSGEDLQLLSTLANQSAIAIRNAWLYSRLLKDLDTIRDLEREKAKAERLASLGTMAAGIAHEIKNPLASIKTFAQLLPEKSSDPEFRNVFSSIATKEIDRIDSLVLGLLSLAKPSPPKLESTNVNSVLDETLTSVAVRMEEGEIQLKKEYEKDLPQVMADGLQLKQVFSNIVINSIQATPEGGRISVITSWQRDSGGKNGHVEIKISDTGVGIPQKELDKIFNPFYTTKHEGIGLGLAICHRIIKDHEGDIHLESKKGAGTTFTISLPVTDEEHSTTPSNDNR